MKKTLIYFSILYSISNLYLYFLFILIYLSNEVSIIPLFQREAAPLITLLFFISSILLYVLFLISKNKNIYFSKLKKIQINKTIFIIILINNILTIHFFLNPYIIIPFID